MSRQQENSGTFRRTVLKAGGGAIGGAVIGGGALLYSSQPAAAADGVNTATTVELDSNEQDVTGVTIAPEIGFEWSDFSDGVDHFQLAVQVTPEPGLTKDAMNSLLSDGRSIDAGTVSESWNNQSSGSQVNVVNNSEFSPDGSNNSDVSDVTTASDASFDDASGTGTINLTEQSLRGDSFSTGIYPQEISDGEAAGTRVTIDISLEVRDGSTNNTVSSEAIIDFDTIEYGVIIDNPSSGGSAGETTLNTGVTGE